MTRTPQPLSIVVPALNEAGNLPLLVERISQPLKQAGITHEVLIVDDHSSDDSSAVVAKLAQSYPVRIIIKQGKRGKASSLLEGFAQVNYPVICMIDADLQYPPEAILPMYQRLLSHNADVVVTNRIEQQTSPLRKLSTKVCHFLLARLLFGIDYDTQSGLKLFRKKVLNGMNLKPSPWSFDLEFLIRSLENHCVIVSYAIPFGERYEGETKVKLLSGTYDLVSSSLRLRMNSSARKVRRGYRASLELSKRPVSMAGVLVAGVIFSVVALSAGPGAKASALSVQDNPVSQAIGQAPSNDGSASGVPSQNQSAPATTTTPAASAATSRPANASAASQPAASPAKTTVSPSTSASSSSSTAKPASGKAASASTTPAATSPSKTAAATSSPSGTEKTDAGKKTDYYPGYGLSASKTDTIKKVAFTLAVSGAIAILLALGTAAARSTYRNRARKASRNMYRV